MYHARHGKPPAHRRARALTAALALAGVSLGAPVTTAPSAHASIVDTGDLSGFLLADGRTRYASEVQHLIDYSTSHGYRIDPANVQVYAVPTVEGMVRYITDAPWQFRVTPNTDRTMSVPTPPGVPLGGVMSTLNTAEVVSEATAGADAVIRIAEDQTAELMAEEGTLDPELMAANVFNVVPFAAPALPVNTTAAVSSGTVQSQPGWQPVDAVTAMAPAVDTVVRQQAERDDPEWNHNNDRCFAVDNNAWFRQNCWNIDNQINDDNADYTFWQFNLQAQSYPKQKRGMLRIWVEGDPRDGTATQWFDRDLPEPKQELAVQSGCTEQIKGMSISGGEPFQLGYHRDFTYTTCESYQPRGYSEQGHYATTWRYNSDHDAHGVGSGQSGVHQRMVAFNMGIRTKAAGSNPTWDVLTGTEVSTKYP